MKLPPSKKALWRIFIILLKAEGFNLEGDVSEFQEDLYSDYIEAYSATKVDPETFVLTLLEEMYSSELFDSPMRSTDDNFSHCTS
jgi:hypothetical protein